MQMQAKKAKRSPVPSRKKKAKLVPKEAEQAAVWLHYSKLHRWEKNPRINEQAVPRVEQSIRRFGFVSPIVIWASKDRMVVGDTRLKAMQRIMLAEPNFCAKGAPGPGMVRVVFHEFANEKEANDYAIADNKLNELALWDHDLLDPMLARMSQEERISLGFDEPVRIAEEGKGNPGGPKPSAGALRARFLIPPFSVLDARQGYWKERKKHWLDLGIRSEIGRGTNLLGMSLHALVTKVMGDYDAASTFIDECRAKKMDDEAIKLEALARVGNKSEGARGANLELEIPGYYAKLRAGQSRAEIIAEWQKSAPTDAISGTSIFDPVLCELAYRWFCPPDGSVLDPFAGGSVRGVVAAALGRSYLGVELRGEQVKANREQWKELLATYPTSPQPKWKEGDSSVEIERLEPDFDFVFSCPPYADLEVYSDDKRDLSTMSWESFLESYRKIIRLACERLKNDRFACFVVGEVREKSELGPYRGFVPETIRAFEEAGLCFYNEAILITTPGTLPLRAGRMFSATRKLGKTHQNVLVFCKGDPRKAIESAVDPEFGEVAPDEALEEGVSEVKLEE